MCPALLLLAVHPPALLLQHSCAVRGCSQRQRPTALQPHTALQTHTALQPHTAQQPPPALLGILVGRLAAPGAPPPRTRRILLMPPNRRAAMTWVAALPAWQSPQPASTARRT